MLVAITVISALIAFGCFLQGYTFIFNKNFYSHFTNLQNKTSSQLQFFVNNSYPYQSGMLGLVKNYIDLTSFVDLVLLWGEASLFLGIGFLFISLISGSLAAYILIKEDESNGKRKPTTRSRRL